MQVETAKDWPTCIKDRMAEGKPFETAQDMCWHILESSSSTAKDLETFDYNGKHFAKFFLINPQRNKRGWRVIDSSIPERIKTFIGRPYISEPSFEHFGAEGMDLPTILQEQEKFRAGNILDVRFNAQKKEAYAFVEITDNKVWNELQKGEAIYVSPAIAGFPYYENNTLVYPEWYGLHLARVKNPAFDGVYASLRRTCTGDEKKCMEQLTAAAAMHGVQHNCPPGMHFCTKEQKCMSAKGFASVIEEFIEFLKDPVYADAKALPWSECIAQQKARGKSQEKADKICGFIKAQNAAISSFLELGLASDAKNARELLLNKIQTDLVFAAGFATEITNSLNYQDGRIASLKMGEKTKEELEAENQALTTKNTDLTTKVTDLTKEVGSLKELTKDIAPMKEKATDYDNLKNQVAAMENEQKTVLANEIADAKVEAELITKENHKSEVEKLVKMDKASLAAYRDEVKATAAKIKELKTKTASEKKIIYPVSTASASAKDDLMEAEQLALAIK